MSIEYFGKGTTELTNTKHGVAVKEKSIFRILSGAPINLTMGFCTVCNYLYVCINDWTVYLVGHNRSLQYSFQFIN
jgi:hypothetical protein